MTSDQFVFAGVDLSSGRRPVTFAALDEDLKILALERLSLAQSLSSLNEYGNIFLSINSSTQAATEFRKSITQAGFKQLSTQSPRRWMETDSQEGFLTRCGHELLSRRSIEGRLQRALILYDARLQIPDPMDYFEEITRYKLIQGILPVEIIYPARELDALMAAYVAWLTVNEPRQTHDVGNRILLLEESDE
jgi:hypothetical protein